MQCTDEEIAAWFGVTPRTIERRRKDPAFSDILERGKAKGRISLRRSQFKSVEQGNPTMQIWLGKQYLGQTDDIQHHMAGPLISVSLPGPGAQALVIQQLAQRKALQTPGVESSADSDQTVDIEPSEFSDESTE